MVSIVEVTTKAQLRRFVDYPNQLYKDVPQFVPATYGDDLADWDRSKNPAFSYCDARCWLAERDGEIVGRIGAIRSRKANEKWGTNRMRFTQVDFIDDPEVSAALFARGGLGQRAWLRGGPRAAGLYRHGPGRYAGGGLRPPKLLFHLL